MKVYGPYTRRGDLVYFPAHGRAGIVLGFSGCGLPRVDWQKEDPAPVEDAGSAAQPSMSDEADVAALRLCRD